MYNKKFFNDITDDSRLIREEVFVKEQGFSDEFDDIDSISIHVVIYDDDKPIGTGRTFIDKDSTDKWIIGRVAVLKDYRGKGIGAMVMSALEEKIKENGGLKSKLSAQLQAQKFYELQGYIAAGNTYYDQHVEHISMEKSL